MKLGRKSTGRTVSFKSLEEDGFQSGAGTNPLARSGRPFFDSLKDPAALCWTDLEKGPPETSTIVVHGLDAETAGFPFVAQGARPRRELVGLQPETVELITSRPLTALPQAPWFEATIQHWGIETGLHARLDASRHDDRCLHPLGQQPVHPLAPATAQRAPRHHHRPPGPFRRKSRPVRDPHRHGQTLSFVNRRWRDRVGGYIRGCNAGWFTDSRHSNTCHAEENICEAARENLAVACPKAGSYRSGQTCFPVETPRRHVARGVASRAGGWTKPRWAAARQISRPAA